MLCTEFIESFPQGVQELFLNFTEPSIVTFVPPVSTNSSRSVQNTIWIPRVLDAQQAIVVRSVERALEIRFVYICLDKSSLSKTTINKAKSNTYLVQVGTRPRRYIFQNRNSLSDLLQRCRHLSPRLSSRERSRMENMGS